MKKCIFAGSFDPITIGHTDMISQCLQLFDEVVVAILTNPDKKPYFSLEEREKLISLAFEGEKRVKVRSYDGLIVDLLREEGTPFYVRGIRNGVDFDYETITQHINKSLYPDIVTLYLPTTQAHLHISSSLVRNCIFFRKDVKEYVPQKTYLSIKQMIEQKETNHV